MDSTIICDAVKESHDEDAEAKSYDETKTIPTNCNEKKATCKIFIFYLHFYWLLKHYS